MREQVKELWKLCFPDDSDEFVNLYFSSRYTDEINSAITEDGRVVSALQRIPYPMQFMDTVIPVAYISGACTHPEFRSRGLMSQLLDEAHRRMYTDGKYLSLLIPANEGLVGYYAKFGYRVSFQQEEKLLTGMCKTVDNSECQLIFNKLCLLENEVRELTDFVNQQLSTYSASILHPLHDMKIVLSDLHLSGGQAWTAHDEKGNLCALALLIASDNQVVIKELVATEAKAESAMLSFIFSRYSVSEAVKPSPCGMARVINAYRMLEAVAHGMEGRHIVEIYGDSLIPENNGVYFISDGKCRKTENHDCVTDAECLRMHINDMPSWLFRNMKPYMSLMLD